MSSEQAVEQAVKRSKLPILCLDFDGVIHSYASGWKGANVVTDPPVAGAMGFLSEAVDHFRVAIFSSRSGQKGGIDAMRIWLRLWLTNELDGQLAEYVYSRIEFPTEKPPAMIGIDDRVLTFTGRWPLISDLKGFKPWNKGGRHPEDGRETSCSSCGYHYDSTGGCMCEEGTSND